MIKDLTVKNFNVHIEENSKGSVIIYKKDIVRDGDNIIEYPEQHIFQPLFQKHQQLYDIYREIKDKELTPLELVSALNTFRYTRRSQNQIILDYKDNKCVYMKFEASDKAFESDGKSTLIVGRAKHQRGMLIQHYVVNVPIEFPTEADLNEMFQADSMSQFIDNLNAWLPAEPKGDPEPSKEQTPEEIQAQTAQA